MKRIIPRMISLFFGFVLIAAGIPNPVIGATSQAGSAWSLTIVDHGPSPSSGPSFADPSIAVDAAGRPWISYTANDGTLKLAKNLTGIWNLQTVNNHTSTGWSSLAIDKTGNPQISYQSDSTHLDFIHLDSSAWVSVNIDTWVPGESGIGDENSIDVDSQGRSYVTYINNISNSKGDLVYAYSTGSTWTKVKMEKTFQRNPTVKVDSQDNPHIGYISYDDTAKKNILRYRAYDGNDWVVQDWIPACSDCLSEAAMALDSSGNPYIVFMNDSTWPNSKVQVAHWNGTVWTDQDVDTAQIYRPSIAVDHNGYPQVCYFDMGKAIQKYAAWDGNQWTIETINTGNGGDCSIALDKGGGVHIAYVDLSRRLVYAGKPSSTSSYKVFLPLIKKPG